MKMIFIIVSPMVIKDSRCKGAFPAFIIVLLLLPSLVSEGGLIHKNKIVIDSDIGPGTEKNTRGSYNRTDVDNAIERGLLYLNQTQQPDGGWIDTNYGMNANCAGICLRAFLGYNSSDPRWEKNINKTVRFLTHIWHDPASYPAGQQRDRHGGLINNDRYHPTYTRASMYSHGAATAALVDYYFHTKDIFIVPYINDSVKMIERAQNTPHKPNTMGGPRSQGGWRYDPWTTSSDTSASGWNIHAMAIAESSGIVDVNDYSFEYAAKWLKSCSSGNGFGYTSASATNRNTAVGTYCMYLMGEGDDPAAQGGMRSLQDWGPTYQLDLFYYTYHATLAIYLAGGNEWESWKEDIKTALIESQNPDGSWTGEYGNNWGTAMAIMSLELCINPPIRPKFETEFPSGKDEVEEIVTRVEPGHTAEFNFSLSLEPNTVEIPISYSREERVEMDIDLSDRYNEWELEAFTYTSEGVEIELDHPREWQGNLTLDDKINFSVRIKAPEKGGWDETCSVPVNARIENEYGFIETNMTFKAILDQHFDIGIDILCDEDEFLGKCYRIAPGEIRTFPVEICNLGNVNDTYNLSLDYPVHWDVNFDDGRKECDVPLTSFGGFLDRAIVNVTVAAPEFALEGEMMNLTITARSVLYLELGQGKLERADHLSFIVTDLPLRLTCEESIERSNPSTSVDYNIKVVNNYHSPLDVNLTFESSGTVLDPPGYSPDTWSAGFIENTCFLLAEEEYDGIFRVNIPQNVHPTTTLSVTVQASGYDYSGSEFITEPLDIITLVNDDPEVVPMNPENNSVITELSVDLIWECIDSDDRPEDIRYDLYFGKVFPPEIYERNLTALSFPMEGLEDHSTYYWKVIPHDPYTGGSCLNEKMCFTVNSTLYHPRTSLLSPRNTSMVNTSGINLTWKVLNPLGEEITFEIYLGAVPHELIKIGETGDPYFKVEDLADNMTYFWQVIPVGISCRGICNSGVWSFRTDMPAVRLLEMGTNVDSLEIPQGGSAVFDLILANLGKVDLTIFFELSGDLSEFVEMRTVVELNENTERNVVVTIIIPDKMPTGTYGLDIMADYSYGCGKMMLPVRIINSTSVDEEVDGDDETDLESYFASPLMLLLGGLIILLFIVVIELLVIYKNRRTRSKKRQTYMIESEKNREVPEIVKIFREKAKKDRESKDGRSTEGTGKTADGGEGKTPKGPVPVPKVVQRKVSRKKIVKRRSKSREADPSKLLEGVK